MKRFSFVRQAMMKGFVPYFLLFALIVFFYFCLNPFMNIDHGSAIRTMMQFGLCAVLAFLIVGYFNKTVTFKQLVFAIILCGVMIRIGYMSYTPFYERGHDIEGIADTGHYSYIYTIFRTGKLPDTNIDQFYHPPLQHLLSAAFARIVYIFRPSSDMDTVFDVIKIIPCFASCAMLPVCYKICTQLRLSKLAIGTAVAIMAFHPTFFILSASINNDTLMVFFFMAAILYTIRWYETPSYKNIILLAFSIGLGMMTKISVGEIALFIAPVFIIVFVQHLKAKNWKEILHQHFVFAGICFPLALWYPIRNMILFRQSFFYVLDLTGVQELYSGGYSLTQRFLSFPLEKLTNPTYCDAFKDYNVWLYTVKCSMFGEYTFERPKQFAQLLIIANFLLILISLAAMVYVIISCKKTHPLARFGLFSIWLVQMAFYLQFNLKYPFGCTMDFRYIIPTVLVGAIYIGMALNHLRNRNKVWSWSFVAIGWEVIFLFVGSSVLFYV